MNETKKRYAKKCKVKTITFYKNDADILAYANSINFQAYVKQCLKITMLKQRTFKKGANE